MANMLKLHEDINSGGENMPIEKRPVSYQQTLGTKTGKTKKEAEKGKSIEMNQVGNLKEIDTNFPE